MKESVDKSPIDKEFDFFRLALIDSFNEYRDITGRETFRATSLEHFAKILYKHLQKVAGANWSPEKGDDAERCCSDEGVLKKDCLWAIDERCPKKAANQFKSANAGKWVSGVQKENLPPDDSYEDFPKQYFIRIKGDDPRSGWVGCDIVTAEQMRNIKEDYWEWWLEGSTPSEPTKEETK